MGAKCVTSELLFSDSDVRRNDNIPQYVGWQLILFPSSFSSDKKTAICDAQMS